jgi:hypothetical protein
MITEYRKTNVETSRTATKVAYYFASEIGTVASTMKNDTAAENDIPKSVE